MSALQWLISEESVNTFAYKIYHPALKQNMSPFSDRTIWTIQMQADSKLNSQSWSSHM